MATKLVKIFWISLNGFLSRFIHSSLNKINGLTIWVSQMTRFLILELFHEFFVHEMLCISYAVFCPRLFWTPHEHPTHGFRIQNAMAKFQLLSQKKHSIKGKHFWITYWYKFSNRLTVRKIFPKYRDGIRHLCRMASKHSCTDRM